MAGSRGHLSGGPVLAVLAAAALVLGGCARARSLTPTPAAATPTVPLRATTASGYIGERQAIELARMYCQAGSQATEAPHDVRARLVPWQEVRQKLPIGASDSRPPEARVWVVSMAGTWLHYGPPPEPGTPHVPFELKRCSVVIDARSGDLIATRMESSDTDC